MKKQGLGKRISLLVLIPIFLIGSCLVSTLFVYQGFSGLPGTLRTKVSIRDLTQVVVPGEAKILFDQPGVYAVYYEHRSIVQGTHYISSSTPPKNLGCRLTDISGQLSVLAVPDYDVEFNRYSTKDQERIGVMIKSFNLDQPGQYTFSCQYEDGSIQPDVVLAVGPHFTREFLNILLRIGVSIFSGMIALGLGIVLSIILSFIVFKRN
ncbi:MAG: hypothetical protein ABIJ65_09910 [Chloroflexota bacterium]